MKFKTLNGREIRLQLEASKYPLRSAERSPSKGQYNLGVRIQEIYSGSVILEEFVLPGSKLSVDFFVPDSKIAFEFHGIQHDEFNKFFHGDKSDLEKQKKRDNSKKEWCQLNNITLIEVRDPYCSTEELKQLITDSNAKS